MNTFNRILGVLLGLGLMGAGAPVLLAAAGVVTPAWPFADLLDWAGRSTAVAAGAGALAAGLVLLIAEIATAAGRRKRVVVKDDEMGTVSVSLEGIEELVTREARRVGGVRDARSRVDHDGNGLEIVEFVSVAPEASVPELSRELQERTRSVVEHYVGRPVKQVRVDARLARGGERRQ